MAKAEKKPGMSERYAAAKVGKSRRQVKNPGKLLKRLLNYVLSGYRFTYCVVVVCPYFCQALLANVREPCLRKI